MLLPPPTRQARVSLREFAQNSGFPHSTARIMAQLTAEHMPIPSLRVGVDLVRVADVASSITRFGDRYVERIFTPDERAYCDADAGRSAQRYAARFAAKEATLKVLR